MDFPEITEMEINPFGINQEGGMALDAKVGISPLDTPKKPHVYEHLSISPYPDQYQKQIKLKDGQQVLLRPIKPEDEPLEIEMFKLLSKESVYFRFFGHVRVTHEMVARFTQIDYNREIAIVAEIEKDGKPQIAGVVRMVKDIWHPRAEYAIITADPWQGLGLGTQMTDFILEIARERGIKEIYATVLNSNTGMLKIFERNGFSIKEVDGQTSQASLIL
jgi:acetyltransferase